MWRLAVICIALSWKYHPSVSQTVIRLSRVRLGDTREKTVVRKIRIFSDSPSPQFHPTNILHCPMLPLPCLIYHFHFITVFPKKKKKYWLAATGDHVIDQLHVSDRPVLTIRLEPLNLTIAKTWSMVLVTSSRLGSPKGNADDGLLIGWLWVWGFMEL